VRKPAAKAPRVLPKVLGADAPAQRTARGDSPHPSKKVGFVKKPEVQVFQDDQPPSAVRRSAQVGEVSQRQPPAAGSVQTSPKGKGQHKGKAKGKKGKGKSKGSKGRGRGKGGKKG
jgi:hypothetical protein